MSFPEPLSSESPASNAPLQFVWEPVGKQLQTRIRVEADGRTIDVDTVDLGKAAKRREFAERVASVADAPVEAVETELLRITDLRGAPEPATVDEPVADDLAERTKTALGTIGLAQIWWLSPFLTHLFSP
jgi:hypothetical protein